MQKTPVKTQTAAVGSAGDQLQLSRYDRASSLLLALLIVVGIVAVLLFVLWLTFKLTAPPPKAGSPHIVKLAGEGENGGNRMASGGTTQLDTPSDDEPMFGKDNKTSGVQDELKRLDVAALSKKTHLDDPDADVPTRLGSHGRGKGRYIGDGPGDGPGDQVGRRPGNPAPPSMNRNWEVSFSKNTLDAYARQLDSFKIELGVLLPDNKIKYVYNLTKSKPDSRTVANPAASENRYYLTWRSGEMQQADQELLARAGVDVGDSIIVKFLPLAIEEKLAELEKNYAGADTRRILKTRFGVQPDGAGFKFIVMGQSYKR